MITVDTIRSGYGKVQILSALSFSIEQGVLCGLFGPNGSGKTTLLRCLSGAHQYEAGSIRVKDRELSHLKPRDIARFIAYVPQAHSPPFPFLVKEVVLMGRNPFIGKFSGPGRTDKEHTWKVLVQLHIESLADRPYTELSGGQRQLVLLARALNQDTPVLLLDEPASALDFKNQIILWNLLRTLAASGKTIIVCSHDPNHITWFCDHVVIINNGTVLTSGDPQEVMNREVLSHLYGNLCGIGVCEDKMVIVPRDNLDM